MRYDKFKEAILRHYEETYRQRFREPSKKEGELVGGLAVKLTNLFQNSEMDQGVQMVEEIRDMLVKGQLLSSLPTEERIHVSERKPTSAEVA